MKQLLQQLKDFLFSPTHSRTLGVLLVMILIVGTIVTVQVLPQQTNTQQHASTIGGGGGAISPAPSNACQTSIKTAASGQFFCNNNHQVCTTETVSTCSTYVAYSNCQNVAGKCGYVPPTPTPIYNKKDAQGNNTFTCGPTNNGTCYWHETNKATLGLACDPNAYTSDHDSSCSVSGWSMPSCDFLTHTSGATESTVNENKCTDQGGGNVARCCIPGKPVTATTPVPTKTTVTHSACVTDYGTATYPHQGSNQLKDASTGKAIANVYCASNQYCHVTSSAGYETSAAAACHTGTPPTTSSLPTQVCTCANAGNPASGQNGFTCVYPASTGKAPLNTYCSNGIACNQVDKNTILCGNKGYGTSNKTCAHPYIAPSDPNLGTTYGADSNAIYQDGKIVAHCPSADDYCYNDANGVPQCANRDVNKTINICQFPGNKNDGMNIIAVQTYKQGGGAGADIWLTKLSYCAHGVACSNVNGTAVCSSGSTTTTATTTPKPTTTPTQAPGCPAGTNCGGGNAPTAPNVCRDKPAQTNLVLSPVCSSGKISEVKANFPAASGSTGYILYWWFHRSVSGKDEYNECAKAFTANGTAVGSYSNNAGGANRELGTSCFDSNATSFGAAYRIETKACTGPSSNPATYIPMTVCQATTVTLNVKLPGIGTAQFENTTPAHPTRNNVGVVIFDQAGSASTRTTTTLTYNSATGLFVSTPINVGVLPYTTAKEFRVYIGVPQFLKAFGRKDSSKGSIISLTPGVANTVTIYPQPGDIVDARSGNLGQDDVVDASDYNVLRACYNQTGSISMQSGNTTVSVNCADTINFLDYSDGGTTGDEFAANYNAWLRSSIAACSANSKCTGD